MSLFYLRIPIYGFYLKYILETKMNNPKVIITKQKAIAQQYSFENEVGLSSYDLALISINKISKKRKSYINDSSVTTFSL